MIEQASSLSGSGWTAYAPLTASPDLGLRPWVQAVLWLFLIAVWTVAALWLLREPKPGEVDAKEGEPMAGDD